MAKGLTGGQLIAKMLAAEGVEDMFGIIDGTYFGLYRALGDNGIELHSPRHEAAAMHMAGAYARLTGRLGVAMASNGPGVANVLPGVAVEEGEGNRILLITSSRRVPIAYPDRGGTYQYFNQVGVTAPMTKFSVHVPSADRIPELMRRALRVSFTGRPGVVHIDIPENIINQPTEMDESAIRAPESYRRTTPIQADPVLVSKAAKMLVDAQQPVIHAGSGVYHAGAEPELARLAQLLAAPVTTSWAARGALPENLLEAIPMTALAVNDEVRSSADVALIVGSRMGETDWWGKAPNWAKPGSQATIQIDNDEARLGVNKPVTVALLADAKEALRALADAVEELGAPPNKQVRIKALEGWRSQWDAERAKLDKPLASHGAPVHPAHVPSIAQSVMPEDTVWVFDGGNTAVWSNFYHDAKVPRTTLSTFKFGMLGAGMGQALGAAVAAPDQRVCVLTGDGAFGMHSSEVESAVRLNLPIVFVVLVDGQWGMVKMSQQIAAHPVATVARKMLTNKSLPDDQVVYADFAPCRYDLMAEAFGAHGEHVTDSTQLRGALERARDCGRAAVVQVDVNNVEHLWAPALQSFKKMHQEPKG
ncbi:MAG: thiamine pyrophosphate-binding protein [Actinobacteria bacterium]|nr:thiamine pyrophosphate-binding protein [Actinomycetota bacterium]MCO5299408.1 thiamine pyrophosphate-binding protein [Candidatus Nanopelagicales bacterium]